MKRYVRTFLFVVMAGIGAFVFLSAPGAGEKASAGKKLIVYYSWSGKTETAAKVLAAELKADILKIEDVKPPSKFKAYVSGAYAARKGKTWPIKPVSINIADYAQIFIGAPVWWGRAAPEINTFISRTDFTGRTVVVFVTMGGSDPVKALKGMTASVEARGGKVASSFSIKTGKLSTEGIEAKAKEIAKQFQ